MYGDSILGGISDSFIVSLSNFADQAVIMPLAVAIGIFLLVIRWNRGAFAWAIGIGGTLLTVVIAKLFFYIVGNHLPFGINLHSPSAHSAAGAVVYGGLVTLLLRRGRAGIKTALVSSGIFALIFSITRLTLGVHTRSEVVLGSFFGMLGTATFVYIAGRKARKFNPIYLLIIASLIIFSEHGKMFYGEVIIRHASEMIKTVIKHAMAHSIL